MIKKFDKSMLNDNHFHVRKKFNNASYQMHWHEYFEFTLYCGCSGTHTINGNDYKVEGNCLFLVTPMDFHQIQANSNTDSYSIIVGFSESIVDPCLLSSSIAPLVIYSPSTLIKELFEELLQLYKTKDESMLFKARLLINYILTYIKEQGTSLALSSAYLPPIINKAITYCLKNFSTNILLDDIAKFCRVSPAYFSDLFHRTMGKTFKAWLTGIRIEYAKCLLESGETSVLNVAYECGYNSLWHFIKIFKASTNLTPKEYKNRYKPNI
jgi:AraC-like DNA-binding protein